jgi:hypothetical protein
LPDPEHPPHVSVPSQPLDISPHRLEQEVTGMHHWIVTLLAVASTALTQFGETPASIERDQAGGPIRGSADRESSGT